MADCRNQRDPRNGVGRGMAGGCTPEMGVRACFLGKLRCWRHLNGTRLPARRAAVHLLKTPRLLPAHCPTPPLTLHRYCTVCSSIPFSYVSHTCAWFLLHHARCNDIYRNQHVHRVLSPRQQWRWPLHCRNVDSTDQGRANARRHRRRDR